MVKYQEFLEYLIGICDQSDEDGCSHIGAAWLRGLCRLELGRLAIAEADGANSGPAAYFNR